ncbi:MAG: class I SAM-dependent methyltransferase [candidate division Zixibacteria bacterium]|nr:class I SAM-dependent methyltransferase [candidate division Zixibacteria bacterium]
MKRKSFFDIYAHEYDLMTDAARREKNHAEEVKAILKKFQPTTVLDAGCATGLTTRLLAAEGVTVVGIDRSRKMIELARSNMTETEGVRSFQYGQFEKLPRNMYNKFDLVVCLANAVSGVGTLGGLRKAIKNFRAVLKPGGTLLIQMLNYTALEEGVLMPVRTTVKDGLVFVRMTERRGRKYSLYVIRLDMNQKPVLTEPFRSEFDNFTVDEMTSGLKTTGFVKICKYADLFLNRRFIKSSRDLVITALKPGL